MIVACVLRSGGHFTPSWVDALEYGILNYAPIVDFVCLTDMSDSFACRTIPLATDLLGWWAKIELFRPGLFTGQRVLYLDLDTVVVGNLTAMIEWDSGTLVLSDLYDPANMASGVMSWRGDSMKFIWDEFSKDPAGIMRRHPRRMDHYLRGFLNDSDRIQDEFPGQVVSYKGDLRGQREPYNDPIVIPDEVRLICMHGRPTLTDLSTDDPVRKAWGR